MVSKFGSTVFSKEGVSGVSKPIVYIDIGIDRFLFHFLLL